MAEYGLLNATQFELPGGLMLLKGVRESGVAADSDYLQGAVTAGLLYVVDPDAEPPPVLPFQDPLYVPRGGDGADVVTHHGGGVEVPFPVATLDEDGKLSAGVLPPLLATDVEVVAALAGLPVDGAAGTASLRTLGAGAQQAAKGADLAAEVADRAAAIAAIGGRFRGDWAATTDYKANDVARRVSDGVLISTATARTSRASYDATEAGFWTLATAGSSVPATTSVLGTAKLASAPVDAASPIVVGDNDSRLAGLSPFRRPPTGQPLIGRQWATRFDASEEDAAWLNISGMYVRTSDADGLPILRTVETITANRTDTSFTLTNVVVAGGATGPQAGDALSGTGVTATVVSYDAVAGTILMSAPATSTGTGGTIAVESFITTKHLDIKDVEIYIRYKPTASTSTSSAYARCYGRRTGPLNYAKSEKRFHTAGGSKSEGVYAFRNGSASASGQYTTAADTTLGVPRWAKLRIVNDVMYAKWWFAWTKFRAAWSGATAYLPGDGVQVNTGGGGSENVTAYVAINAVTGGAGPAADTTNWVACEEPNQWMYIRRLVTSASVDFPALGAAGVSMNRLTCDIYEMAVTELLPRPGNLLRANPALRDIETSTGLPVNWSKNKVPTVGNTVDIVDVTLPAAFGGGPAKALHLLHTVGEGNFWATNLYNTFNPGSGVSSAKMRYYPQFELPRLVRITGLSKGLNVVNIAPSGAGVSSSLDIYAYPREGGAIQFPGLGESSLLTYFWPIGGDGLAGQGRGTWDWHYFEILWEINPLAWAQMSNINPQFGFHDLSTGELWVACVNFEPLA